MSKNNIEKSKLLNTILEKGIHGAGPFKSAQAVADEALRNAGGDAEKAIERVIRNHSRMVGTSGFASGLGGGNYCGCCAC